MGEIILPLLSAAIFDGAVSYYLMCCPGSPSSSGDDNLVQPSLLSTGLEMFNIIGLFGKIRLC